MQYGGLQFSYTVKNDVLYRHKNCVILMHFFDMSGHVILTYFLIVILT